jgi:hypothetical protein
MRSSFSRIQTMPLSDDLFTHLSAEMKTALMSLRDLVLDTARTTEGVGPIEEALRWDQLSFITAQTKSGSTIRIDVLRNDPNKYAVYVHCQSGLIDEFRNRYPSQMTYVDQRSIVFTLGQPLPMAELKHCISLALTYHLRKKMEKTKRKK